jgi:hypothetical protein
LQQKYKKKTSSDLDERMFIAPTALSGTRRPSLGDAAPVAHLRKKLSYRK